LTVLPTPFVFGKVPDRGDFVRAGRIGPLVDELDEWLQRGLLALRRPVEGEPTIAFVFGRPSGTLVGAFVASRDRAGRSFPLAVGGSLDGGPAVTGVGVAARGTFLATAATVATEIVGGLAPDEALPRLEIPPSDGEYAHRAPFEVFGTIPVDRVVARLTDSLGPFRQPQAPRYGLGLPLPEDPGFRAVAAAFWLDVVGSHSSRRPATSMLWTAGAGRSRLALFTGAPSSDALTYLFAGVPVDGVYDIDAPDADVAGSTAPTLRMRLARS
jgi:type VI secretion system protein ImpM